MRPAHGGDVSSRKLIDFSTSLNQFAPDIDDETWMKWRHDIQFYPSQTTESANRLVADYFGLPASNVIATNGGLEALKCALMLQPNNEVLIPSPCFSEYAFLCDQLQISYDYKSVIRENWIKPEEWLPKEEIAQKTILLANPNNPTGISIPASILRKSIEDTIESGTFWIIDEAFVDFCDKPDQVTLLQDLSTLPNLIICGSMTKQWKIPGLRIGYICYSSAKCLQKAQNDRITWPLPSITENWLKTFLSEKSQTQLKKSLEQLRHEKTKVSIEIQRMNQIRMIPSDANFLLCELVDSRVEYLDKFLTSKGTKIRVFNDIPALNNSFFRIGIRTASENQFLIAALYEYFAKR